MLRTASVVAALGIFSSASAWDQRRPLHFNDREHCHVNPADPFEPAAISIGGLDKGKCLDSSAIRPIVLLFPDEAARYGLISDAAHVVAANVRDLNRWMVAEIPVNAVDRVTFLVEHFVPGPVEPGHSALRLHFREPVRLRPQFGGGRGYETRELMLSANANEEATDLGEAATKVFDNSLGFAMGILTMREVLGTWVVKHDFRVEQWKLDMTPDVAKRHLVKYLKRGDAFSLARPYHLTARNCMTEHLDILDSFTPYTSAQHHEMRAVEALTGNIVPIKGPAALKARGFIRSLRESRMPDLAEDPSVHLLLEQLRR